MLDLDTSRPLRSYSQIGALVEAIYKADPKDELDWVEWKSRLDLTTHDGRGNLARHILGMANRQPEMAARIVGGCGYILWGIEPGDCIGVTAVDLATLEPQIQPFLGNDGPIWDPRWVQFKGKDVLVVIVEPPKAGDPPWALRKDFSKYRDGALFVRRKGATHNANSHEVAELFRRARPVEEDGRLHVQLLPTPESPAVIPIDVGDEAVSRWVETERHSIMAPLIAQQPGTENDIPDVLEGSSLSLDFMETARAASDLAHAALGRYLKPEDRSQEEFEAEVDGYLNEAAGTLRDVAISRHVASGACLVTLSLSNPTDHPWRDVETELYLPGDGFKAMKGPGYSKMPKPPRAWGDRWVNPLAALDSGIRVPLAPSILEHYPGIESSGPWVEIDNGGSARLTFSPTDLPPRTTRLVAEFHLVVDASLAGSRISGDWTARSTHASGVCEGPLEIGVLREPALADELVAED